MKLLFFLLFISQLVFGADESTKKIIPCLSTREFITTMEFLRAHKEYGVAESETRVTALKVSEGCTGASKRFIQVTNVLVKAGVPSGKAFETALKFSHTTDELTQAFLSVFKGAFIESLLDLNIHQALTIALEVSESYSHDSKLGEKNFSQLVEFCVDKKSLDLPLLECARLSARIMKNGAQYSFNISSEFISLFHYLTEPNKSNLPTFKALEVSEYVTKFGPESKGNFIQGLEYALSKEGLDKPFQDALEFAKLMASKSIKN